jgi:hypothetical protein
MTTLQEFVIEWEQSIDFIAGDLGGLITNNDVAPSTAPKRTPKVGWGAAGNRALKGMFRLGAEKLHHARHQGQPAKLLRRSASAEAYASRNKRQHQGRQRVPR